MALKQIGEEVITVSTTAIGVTAAELITSGDKLGVTEVHFQHEDGGRIRINSKATPLADGTIGKRQEVGSEWKVTGDDDITAFLMVKETGEADATVNVQLFGYP